jgi:hypothetical protein
MSDSRGDIIEIGNRLMWAFDDHEWAAIRPHLAEKLLFDASDVTGEPAEQLTREGFEARTRALGERGTGVHLVGNQVVDLDAGGATATLRMYVDFTHVADVGVSRLTRMGGTCRLRLRREEAVWQIDEYVVVRSWSGSVPADVAL